MRLSVGVCLAWLTIFVPSSVYAQTTVPADKPEPSAEDAERPSDVQNTRPLDTRGTTGQGEIDSNDTHARTRDDVIREILSNHLSDKHRPPAPPR